MRAAGGGRRALNLMNAAFTWCPQYAAFGQFVPRKHLIALGGYLLTLWHLYGRRDPFCRLPDSGRGRHRTIRANNCNTILKSSCDETFREVHFLSSPYICIESAALDTVHNTNTEPGTAGSRPHKYLFCSEIYRNLATNCATDTLSADLLPQHTQLLLH